MVATAGETQSEAPRSPWPNAAVTWFAWARCRLAATNCLNFGNPQKPEIMWQFSEVIDGMAEACRVFETPVTGGNVSLYNETLGEGIYPTPVIGIVGLIEPVTHTTGCWFADAGQVVALLGQLTIAKR